MKRVTAIATATVLALLVALTLNVAAQQPDTRDRTIMTFSSAVELPGMRLEPGTYVFRLADTASRNVIQVLDQEEKNMLGQWLFVSAERPEVTGDTVVTFRETSAASTPAVQFWYYPGEKIGKEFIYPKDQAMRIAQRTGATVQTEDGPVSATAQASVSADTGSAQASVSAEPVQETTVAGVVEGPGLPDTQTTTAVGISGSGRNETEVVGTSGRNETEVSGTAGISEQVAVDSNVGRDSNIRQEGTIAQQSDTTANAGVANELPATASPLALSGLLALLSLAGAAGIRSFRL
jgi:hypothetical protein